MLEETIRDKCSQIFDEALYIVSDSNTLEKHKDLFIEQSKALLQNILHVQRTIVTVAKHVKTRGTRGT